MMCRYFASQKGFSLVRLLLILVIVAGAALYFMPTVGGDTFTVINQLSERVKGIVNVISGNARLLSAKFGESFDGISGRLTETTANLLDKLNFKQLSSRLKAIKEEWQRDMQKLINASRARGFDMAPIEQSYDEYAAGNRSWRRVETQYWNDLRNQTQKAIEKSFQHFLMRQVGCSDFTVELKKVWEIGEAFNQDTFEGYARAKELSDEIYNPRSMDFISLLFEWFSIAGIAPSNGNGWFVQQLGQALAAESGAKVYPEIIRQVDAQAGSSEICRIIADVIIAEIYLNYDLLNGAMERYDEAIRNLYSIASRVDQGAPYSYQALGMHMALGLLNERMCSNADLALKEFKDVVAIARRLNIPCNQYNDAHYHLAILNLQIRERTTIVPQFVKTPNPNTQTVEQLLPAATATPSVTATPTPTATPVRQDVKVTVEVTSRARGIDVPNSKIIDVTPTPDAREERPATTTDREERPATTAVVIQPVVTPTAEAAATPTPLPDTYAPGDIKKGTIPADAPRRAERDIRLRPRQELGDSVKMKKFAIEQLYDLSRIPEDAVREFERFLKCENEGQKVEIARYVLNKHLGK